MKIVYIDTIIFDLQKVGGISVYFYEIINRLLHDETIECHFIVSNKQKNNIYWDKINIPKEKIIIYNKFLNRYRAVNYKENSEHTFISSYYRYSKNKHAKNITIVHDFTYEYFSKGIKKFVHHLQKMKAIYKSQISICISKNTQNDLNNFSKREVNSTVIYNGVSDSYKLMSNEEINKYIKSFDLNLMQIINSGKFVLFVGQRSGYKNWKGAVKLFKQMPSEYYMFSIGGGDLNDEEKHLLGDDINRHFKLNGLSEEQLCLLYNKAYCLLYLSEYEGFGLPVIEAISCGCPVVAMNKSSIPEISADCNLVKLVDEINNMPFDLKHDTPINKYNWDKTYGEINKLI